MTLEDRYEEQLKIWERLYERICKLLERFGQADSLLGMGDYSVYGDYWGYPQVKVSVGNLSLLQPRIVKLLQKTLTDFPGWEIVVAVTVRGPGEAWPEMGLIVRGHEIVDGLQRQYFPKEFQSIAYEGSRQGTDRD